MKIVKPFEGKFQRYEVPYCEGALNLGRLVATFFVVFEITFGRSMYPYKISTNFVDDQNRYGRLKITGV